MEKVCSFLFSMSKKETKWSIQPITSLKVYRPGKYIFTKCESAAINEAHVIRKKANKLSSMIGTLFQILMIMNLVTVIVTAMLAKVEAIIPLVV